MATRSFIMRQNNDKTFSGRYHHWDGYPEGLGLFLNKFVNTPKKLDWVFNLRHPFSTLLSAPQSQLTSKDVAYPDFFQFQPPRRVSLLIPHEGTQGVFENLTWEKTRKFAQESFTYLHIDDTWNVILRHDLDFHQSKYIGVERYICLASLATVLDEDQDKVIQNIRRLKKTNRGFALNPNMSSVKKAIHCWVETPKDVLEAFKRDVLHFEYDFEEDHIQRIDHMCHSFVQKQLLQKEVSKAKKKKDKDGISPSRKL